MTNQTKRPGLWARAGEIAKSYLTAPDGESYAPGRLMGLIVFALAQGIAIYVVQHVGGRIPPVSVADWQVALVALAAWEVAICGTAVGLILGVAPTDSGGKWWSKDASPPPPPIPETKP